MIIGGLVSSTAVVTSMAARVKESELLMKAARVCRSGSQFYDVFQNLI